MEKNSPRKTRRLISVILGIFISVAAISYVLQGVDYGQLKTQISRFSPRPVVPLALMGFVMFLVRGLRWRYLLALGQREKVSVWDLYEATVFGFAATSVLPLRAGEIVRPLFLKRFNGVHFASAFSSIFSERVFDLLAVLALGFVALSQISDPPAFLSVTAKALGVIAGIGVLGIVFCSFLGQLTLFLAERLLRLLCPERLRVTPLEFLRHAVDALSVLRRGKDLLYVVLLSVLLWSANAVYYQYSLLLLGERAELLTGALLATTIAFAVAAPSSPGFIGTFQFGCTLTLSNILGYPEDFSLAYGILIHLIQTGTTLLLTFAALLRRGLRWGSVISTNPKE